MTIKIQLFNLPLLGNVKKFVDECFYSNWIYSKKKFFQELEQTFEEYIQRQCATIGSKAARRFRVEVINHRDMK